MSLPLALFKLNNEVYYMNKYIFTIGRGNLANGLDLSILDNHFISRNHLSVSYADDFFVVKCLSKNGIFIDEILLMENVNPHKIPSRCSFRFPSTEIVVHFESLLKARIPQKSIFTEPQNSVCEPSNYIPQQIIDRGQTSLLKETKPPYSYAQLISQAIGLSPHKRATLSEIYSYITNNYPYFNPGDRSWQNSIRHNLSLSPHFVRMTRSPNESGKGSYWCFEADAENLMMASAFMKRRSTTRKPYRKQNPPIDSAPASPIQSRPAKFMKVKYIQSAPASPTMRYIYGDQNGGDSH